MLNKKVIASLNNKLIKEYSIDDIFMSLERELSKFITYILRNGHTEDEIEEEKADVLNRISAGVIRVDLTKFVEILKEIREGRVNNLQEDISHILVSARVYKEDLRDFVRNKHVAEGEEAVQEASDELKAKARDLAEDFVQVTSEFFLNNSKNKEVIEASTPKA